jgi:hypothetical protein
MRVGAPELLLDGIGVGDNTAIICELVGHRHLRTPRRGR